MKLAAGICTWQDGDALDACLTSLEGVVDHIYFARGPIRQAVPDEAIARWIADAPNGVAEHRSAWPTLASMRDACLQAARQDGVDWLLCIDADEALHRGDQLRDWLDLYGEVVFPLPFKVDPGWWIICLQKLINVHNWVSHDAQSYYLTDTSGQQWMLPQIQWDGDPGLPYLTHHPELRPEWRQAIRMNELEGVTDPRPEGARVLDTIRVPQAIRASASLSAVYYCPGCGARYATPGQCTNEHPAIDLEKLPDEAPDEVEVDPANGTQVVPAEPVPTEPQAPPMGQPAEPGPPPVA